MALVDRIAKASGATELVPIPGSQVDLPKPKPMEEVGVTGLLRTKGVGYVYEEWLRDLSTHRQKQIYREMRDNDATIGAMFFALEMILRRAEWRIDPAPGRKGDQQAEFVKTCMEDLSHTWEDFVAECVSMFAFGFSLFETVYKRRLGPDGRSASRFDDGLIGWRKFAPRAQESILYWIWDDEGGLQGAVQLAAPDYKTVPLPISKLLLFRTTTLKNNPEGRSLLRNCYRSWFFKRRIEEVEGIGIERDLCGLPVLYLSEEAKNAIGGEANAHKIVRNVRVDDQAGLVLPLAFDDKGNALVKFELVKSGGGKQVSASETIKRYNADMLNSIMSGFIQFGEGPTGSRALHLSATAIFSLAISAFMDSVAAVINRIAIPRLLALNKMDLSLAPKVQPGEVGVRDLKELGEYISQLSQAGLSFFDHDTEAYLRKIARLPDPPDADESGPAAPPPKPGEKVPPTGDGKPKPGSPEAVPQGSDVPTPREAKERLQETA